MVDETVGIRCTESALHADLDSTVCVYRPWMI